MYKVKNGVPGYLALQLEKGSISLAPNKSFDLDPVCSRRWIKNDPVLNHLLEAKHLILMFDSEVNPLGKTPLTPINRIPKGAKPAKPAVVKPEVIDLGVEEEDPPEAPSKPKVTPPQVIELQDEPPKQAMGFVEEKEEEPKKKRKYTRKKKTETKEEKPKRKYARKKKDPIEEAIEADQPKKKRQYTRKKKETKRDPIEEAIAKMDAGDATPESFKKKD